MATPRGFFLHFTYYRRSVNSTATTDVEEGFLVNNIHQVFLIAMTISTLSITAFALTLATWTAQFIRTNRPVRKARHQSIPAYYGHLAAAH